MSDKPMLTPEEEAEFDRRYPPPIESTKELHESKERKPAEKCIACDGTGLQGVMFACSACKGTGFLAPRVGLSRGAEPETLSAFFEEVYALREKHRIANVHVIAAIAILDAEGNEGNSVARYHIGDPLQAEGMTAYAFGAEQSERESLIVHLLAQGKKRGKKS